MTDEHRMIPSGIPPLDARVGGAVSGRLHVLSGGPGTGKTTASLQFIREGLRRGEAVVMLTADRSVDLRSHAAHLGIDLATPLREARLVLLRYRSGFSALLQHTASPEQMLDDLRRLCLPIRPARVVVDSVSPLLASGAHSDATMTALAELFEGVGATTLVTYVGDVTAGRGTGYDYRLEPLLERAAGVFHLARQSSAHNAPLDARARLAPPFQFHVLRVRQPVRSRAPVPFTIEPGSGLALVEPPRADGSAVTTPSRLLALATAEAPSDEILSVPRRDFTVESQQVAIGAPVPDPAAEGAAAVLIEMRHETLDATIALIRDLGAHPNAVPVIGVTRFRLRSADRARALRAGADDVLACDTGPAELLERLHAAVRRGRAHLADSGRGGSRRGEALLTQPTDSAGEASATPSYRPLDRDGFARALAAHVSHDQPTQYTVVSIVPQPMLEPALRALAALAMRSMRVTGGDLAAIVDCRVCVYLHGTRLGDAAPFIERVREQWSVEHRAMLEVESFAYPSDEPLLRTLMKMDESDRAPARTLRQTGSPT